MQDTSLERANKESDQNKKTKKKQNDRCTKVTQECGEAKAGCGLANPAHWMAKYTARDEIPRICGIRCSGERVILLIE